MRVFKHGLAEALKIFEESKTVQSQCIVWAYRVERELLLLRQSAGEDSLTSNTSDASFLLASAHRVLELADETTRAIYPVERDYVRAHWLLGATYCTVGEHAAAERHLHEALKRCRCIHLVQVEADILIALARLHLALEKAEEAQRCAEEALLITERSGYVLQGADANLELAKLALARGDKAAAKDHAQEAEKLAYCDGPPDYTYQVAYEEAQAMLKQLNA